MNILKLFLISLILNSAAVSASAEKLVIVADEWCPYNCAPDSAKPGFMVEIAKTIFAAHGYEVEYKVVPWTRAIEEVRENKYQGLIAGTNQEVPDFVFSHHPQGFNKYNAYSSVENDWVYEGLESLKEVRLGVLLGYGYGDVINAYIESQKDNKNMVQAVSGNNAMVYNISKLKAGRIDVYIENEYVIDDHFASIGEENPFKNAGWVTPENISEDLLYIAISPNHPEAEKLTKILSDGTAELRENGELQKILDKYGLQDWFEMTKK